ncbi:DUF1127 domain-containing protein [Rhodoligotrophos ferricapiens]|uniref:DUF1127 domain-containing protein n=1 Tax=Rhodoligotrophos ferricapiens TaxID=3069264 RepID=UPI00315CE652
MSQSRIETETPRHPALSSVLFTSLNQWLHNWVARRKLRALMELEDTTLRDIGLTRGDVIWASNLPVGEDPVQALSGVSKRRVR